MSGAGGAVAPGKGAGGAGGPRVAGAALHRLEFM